MAKKKYEDDVGSGDEQDDLLGSVDESYGVDEDETCEDCSELLEDCCCDDYSDDDEDIEGS